MKTINETAINVRHQTKQNLFEDHIMDILNKAGLGAQPKRPTLHALLWDRGLCGYRGDSSTFQAALNRLESLGRIISVKTVRGTAYELVR